MSCERATRWGRRGQTIICTTLGLLLAAPPLVILTNLLVFKQATPFIYRSVAEVPARAVAIVPGNTVNHGRPGRTLTERLQGALALYRAGKVHTILVSGNRIEEAGYDEPGVMHDWLVGHGVRQGDIVDDPAGYRTLDTMQRAARVFTIKSAIVCSQGPHLPRSIYLARHAGIDAVGLTSNPHDPDHVLYAPHETLGSALAFVETAVGRGPSVQGPAQPIGGDTRTTALLRPPPGAF